MEVVVPQPLVGLVRASVGTGAVVRGVRPGEKVEVAETQVMVTPAWHGVTIADGYSDGGWRTTGVSRFVGYALTVSGVHDVPFWQTRSSTQHSSISSLPSASRLLSCRSTGGTSTESGVARVGNLDAAEALEFATEIGARVSSTNACQLGPGEYCAPGPPWWTWPPSGVARSTSCTSPGVSHTSWRSRNEAGAWQPGAPPASLELDCDAFCRRKLLTPTPCYHAIKPRMQFDRTRPPD